MQKQKIVIIIGVVLALAGVILINTYVQQREEEIKRQAKKAMAKIQTNQTAVLIAKKDIARGTTIEADMFETSIIPNQYLQPQAVTSLDRIAGMMVNADISKGEQISLAKLSRQEEVSKSSLSSATPAGKRAITISVDNVASLAGMINPGDYVDVITPCPLPMTTSDGSHVNQISTLTLFQNVLVLAIGQNLNVSAAGETVEKRYNKTEKKEISPYVTLALNPEDANLLAFVQEQVKLRLTLRSPIDSNVVPMQPASWETVFQYIMPKKEVVKEEPKKEEVVSGAGESIEIYRGLTKERIPISKG